MRSTLTSTLRLMAAAGLAASLVHATVTFAQDKPSQPPTEPAQPGSGKPDPDQPLPPPDEPFNPVMPGAEFEEPPAAPAAQPTKPMTPGVRRNPRATLPVGPEPAGEANGGQGERAGFPTLGPDDFLFGPYAEPVDLEILLRYVRTEFDLPMIATDTGFIGQKVLIPVPVVLKKQDVLPFIVSLLEQRGYTLVRNNQGIYVVTATDQVGAIIGDDAFSTTRVIPTPGLKPSALQSAISVLNLASTGGQGAKGPATVYMDDLGLILITGSSGQISLVEQLVAKLVVEQARVRQQRFEVFHIAASVARDRLVELAGGAPGGRNPALRQPVRAAGGEQGGAQPAAAAGQTSTGLLALDERVSVDPQSNALYFRGREDELERFSELLRLVDVPNALISRWYPVGGAAEAIANAGKREGLGGVVLEEGLAAAAGAPQAPQGRAVAPGAPQEFAGAGFVIYPDAGGFLYRGTDAQHDRIKALVTELRDLATQELVVVEFYKLKHGKAEDVAGLINELVTGQQARAESPLLGRGLQRNSRDRQNQNQNRNRDPRQPREQDQPALDTSRPATGQDELSALFSDENTSIIADEKNNQIVVRAPKRVQPQYAQLINRIDLRRPQVFIDAQIVAVTDNENFRLAFETQILAGEFAYNSNFGLGTLPGSDIQSKKGVNTGLLGLTAALIKSDQVPLIINALQQNVDGRILSTPQILVDDNETATITREDRVPTQVATQGGDSTITSQGEDATAGTTFTVTPTISENGLKLEYAIELSAFTGSSASPGLAPPSQAVNLDGIVTVPSDATVVVGGLTVENLQNTVLKVPLLGDIPFIGHLFRDTSKTAQNVRVYIFLTPRVLRDPTFADLRLLTRGPMENARVSDIDLPPPQPVRVDIVESPALLAPPISAGPRTAPAPGGQR